MNVSEEFKNLFNRDLLRLKNELLKYQDEEMLWVLHSGINNSAGNLALHLCGNLRHYIGRILVGTDYVRDRDFEFNGRMPLQRTSLDFGGDNFSPCLEETAVR